MNLVALQTSYSKDFQKNLDNLVKLIDSCEDNSLILAPELSLSGYSYERFDEAAAFSELAKEKLLELSEKKSIALTMIIKSKESFYNRFFLFSKKRVIHTQDKYRLFPLGNEAKYFTEGLESDIKIYEFNGLKIATLICFEMRFTQYWQKLLGADIILVPALWGANRKVHYESLSKALAIANQCFVLASNSANEEDAKGSGVITPFGEEFRDDKKELISKKIDLNEIKKMRKYIDIGLK